MSSIARPRVTYNVAKLTTDLAERGWLATDLARSAGVSDMTVSRFLRGEARSAKTAKRLAEAMGYSVRRYVIASRQEASA